MTKIFKPHFIAACLFASLMVGLLSCDDHNTQPEKQNIQFTFSTGTPSDNGRTTDLPENTRLKISIATSSGTPVLSDHEIEVLKTGDTYMTDPVELLSGAYVITDFMIVSDDELLYATPRAGSPLSTFVAHAVPYNFTVSENSAANVNMQVIDGREHAPEEFGFASFAANVVNVLSVHVFTEKNGQPSSTNATAELRQQKKLIKTFALDAGANKIAFEGEPDAVYTLSVFTADEAHVKTFNFKELKAGLGTKPLKITVEPALFLTLDSYVAEGNEYEEYFDLTLEGTGSIHVYWGDGSEESGTLPYAGAHEYTLGTYTAIVTGDIHQITDLWGFSYETYISAIEGLTNLTALKTYNPSWGAVPIHVDLSNCENLETIFIEKYGAPYGQIDLRTDFKLPAQHLIKEFVFYVPGLEETREKVTTEELAVMVSNIYNNATQRAIHNGRFIVTPVSDPSPETQQMLDILQSDYGWEIGLNSEEIYDYEPEAGRSTIDLEARRENWLRNKFPAQRRAARSGQMVFMN